MKARARVPIGVLRDTIQPFPTLSEIYVATLKGSMARSQRNRCLHSHGGRAGRQ
jgi:dihydrolipoamide dehydrogenase